MAANRALLKRFKKGTAKGSSKSTSKGNTGRNTKAIPKGNQKEHGTKLVRDSDLKWKSVDIPDTLDDFGGFYGLEEIDGVDVKVVNGKVLFAAKDEKVKTGEESESGSQDNKNAKADELIEFKNMDDLKEASFSGESEEEEAVEKDSEEEREEEHADEKEEPKEPEDPKVDGTAASVDELQENVFSADVVLDDVTIAELPEWTSLCPLSVITLHGLAKNGFIHPTEIQKRAIPVAMQEQDIMGKAATGSGKTLAYGIPILESLVKSKSSVDPIGLIFTPTRELAQQVTKHLQNMAELVVKKTPYCIVSLTGGLSIQKQQRLLNYEGTGRIVVATPGRFLELIEKNDSFLKRCANIKTLVLDEADRLLQDGHFDEFEKILKHLTIARKGSKKEAWQTMIFSATFSMDLFGKLSNVTWKKDSKNDNTSEMELVLRHLMQKINFKSKPTIIDTNSDGMMNKQIKESLIECGPLERDLYSYYFVTMYPGSTLIFCNAIESVKKLNATLNNLQVSTFQIHSSMTQKARLRNLERYQEQLKKNKVLGKSTVLIASDVAARGLDISDIQHVIHYHLPRTADVYIHRSGRTARAEKEGVSVMICSPEEAQGPLRKLRKLLAGKKESGFVKYKKWQKAVPLLPIEPDIVKQLRDRCRLASELADHDLISTSLRKEGDWLKKAADDLGMDVDSDNEGKDIILAKNKLKKLGKTMSKDNLKNIRGELKRLLHTPLRKDMRKKYLTGGLVNLADDMVKKRGHDTIIGQDKQGLLDLLKNKKRKKGKN